MTRLVVIVVMALILGACVMFIVNHSMNIILQNPVFKVEVKE